LFFIDIFLALSHVILYIHTSLNLHNYLQNIMYLEGIVENIYTALFGELTQTYLRKTTSRLFVFCERRIVVMVNVTLIEKQLVYVLSIHVNPRTYVSTLY